MKLSLKSKFANFLKKFEKVYDILVFTVASLFTMTSFVHAAGTPKLVSGTVSLFQTATTWLLVIIPVAAGAYLGYHALMKSLSDDHAVIAEKNKLMKNVIIGAAIAETASGLITVILSFYS